MDTPIYTIVRNHSGIEKALHWAGDETIVVPANGETKVPFDVWSKADAGQRVSITSSLEDGTVSLSVGVRAGDGNYVETDMCVTESKPQVAVTSDIAKEPAISVMEEMALETSNIVKAVSDTTEANREWYKVQVEHDEPVEHMNTSFTVGTAAKEEDKPAEEPVEEPQEAEETNEARFDALCADKKWQEALDLLKSVFGDKVTFGQRALMTLKTWKAVCSKYGLAE